ARDARAAARAGVEGPRTDAAPVPSTPESGPAAPASRWGVEAAVAWGQVTEVRDRAAGDFDPGPTPIPPGGYVLSGHGAAARWLVTALPVGAAVTIGPAEPRMVPSSAHSIFAFVTPSDPALQG